MTDLETAVRAYCGRHGLKMTELAGLCGVSRQALYSWLGRGSDEDMERIAKALSVPVTYMAGLIPIETGRARLERAITGGR